MTEKILAAVALSLMLAGCTAPQAPQTQSLPMTARDPEVERTFISCRWLDIVSENFESEDTAGTEPGKRYQRIFAEFPTTSQEMQTGLKGRINLHPDTAMLFEFPGDQNPVLWMKDTPSSLDLVFFDTYGEVFYLETGTEPDSQRFLTPEEPDPIATHVLELRANRAEELGIFPGLSHIRIGPIQPCSQASQNIISV